MKDRLLATVANWAGQRPGRLLFGVLLVTAAAAVLMGRLELNMHFKNLMPQDHPMVEEFNRIVDDFSTASLIIVAATGEEAELKAFADEVAPQIEGMSEYVQRVDYRLEREFFLAHGFMLQEEKDLKNIRGIFADLSLLPWLRALNDSFEATYLQDEESISTQEKEKRTILFLDGIQHWVRTVGRYAAGGKDLEPGMAEEAGERFLIGDEYFISPDKDMILLFVRPTFSLSEVDKVIAAADAIDAAIERVTAKYPSVDGGTTGTMALTRDETVAASEDAYFTSLIAFALIIALFILAFRMWTAPLLAGVCLAIGIVWAGGLAALTVGSLNIMTSMFSVILIGLGVDFSIHIISGYAENRATGRSVGEALHQTLRKAGRGVITGGLTTACAFFMLAFSRTAAMKEFGIVAGGGVVCCMAAAVVALPAMLAGYDGLRERYRRDGGRMRSTEFGFLGRMARGLARRRRIVLSAGLAVTALLLHAALRITFDYNYLNMEPVGLTSIKLQDRMEEEFDVTADFVLITAPSVEEARRIAEKAKGLEMVGMVTSVSEYVPSFQEQQRRRTHVEEIRRSLQEQRGVARLAEEEVEAFVDELHRLEDNIIELAQLAFLGGRDRVDAKCRAIVGELDASERAERRSMLMDLAEQLEDEKEAVRNLNRFQDHFAPHFRKRALGMASTEEITLESLPPDIRDQFASSNGDKFLVTIYPSEGVWEDLAFLERFTRRMQEIDPRVTGIPSIFYALIGIIGRDGRNAVLLTLAAVFLLLLWDFRSPRLALLAMVPLVVGAVWMVGVMQVSGLQLTMMNVIVVPLILGVGIDDGVHLLHRYRIEAPGAIETVFTSTGKAVLLTSLTTMLAFGSLVFATYRGLGSMGIALFIGVGTCFLASVLLLPALLGWTEEKNADHD